MTNSTHTCAICLEELVIPCPNMCITECSHIFHLNCLIRSREHNISCPLCRADIPNEQHHNENIEVNDNVIEQTDLIQEIERVLQEIVNGTQLYTRITDIVSNASNNNMVVEQRHQYIEQIHNLCMEFCGATFNNLTTFQHLYNVEHVDYNNVNLNYYSSLYNINQKINEIVERASINDIRNNMTFYRMENDIYDVCLGFAEYLILNIHM